jgi:hypothetical protein
MLLKELIAEKSNRISNRTSNRNNKTDAENFGADAVLQRTKPKSTAEMTQDAVTKVNGEAFIKDGVTLKSVKHLDTKKAMVTYSDGKQLIVDANQAKTLTKKYLKK